MLIRNAKAYIDGVLQPETDIRVHGGEVQEVGHGLIAGSYEAVENVHGDYVLPGFVDVHIHAFRGQDTMSGEAAVRRMSRELYREGVAAFMPTTMSASVEDTARAVDGVRRVMLSPEKTGARVLGAHMEAPFLQPAKCGAQRREFFRAPDMEEFLRMTGEHTEAVRMITLAPELSGSEQFIRAVTRKGVVVSVGHTAATAEQTHQAADWGATHVTHTFNAQPPLHHREPGVPGAALTDDRLYVELICDGVHLHPDVIRLAVRAKGAARVVMITDAMEAAGMPDGEYALGGLPVTVRAGEARLADGTLAGSVLTMRQALHNMIHRFGIPAEQAVRMCTQTPADSVGERKAGRLIPGSPAPLTRWSPSWEMAGILDDRMDR